jgi:hypothetical protein
VQAVGDAREDQRDVVGAEVADGEAEGGGAMLAQRAGEFAAVVDERADQDEQAQGAGGLGGWVGGRGGHERNRNIMWRLLSRKVFLEVRRWSQSKGTFPQRLFSLILGNRSWPAYTGMAI